MNKGDIVRSTGFTNNEYPDLLPRDKPIHGIVVDVYKTNAALWVLEYTELQGHSCRGRVEEGRGWWMRLENLEVIEQVPAVVAPDEVDALFTNLAEGRFGRRVPEEAIRAAAQFYRDAQIDTAIQRIRTGGVALAVPEGVEVWSYRRADTMEGSLTRGEMG